MNLDKSRIKQVNRMPLSAKTARERQLKNEILLQSYVLFSCRRHRFCRRRRRRSQLERG